MLAKNKHRSKIVFPHLMKNSIYLVDIIVYERYLQLIDAQFI